MKYYSIHRPIAPGTFPRPDGNKVIAIENFHGRLYMDDIEREAWGWIEYAMPLSEKDAAAYELVKGCENSYGSKDNLHCSEFT